MNINRSKPARILVAEDNRYTLEIAQILMESAGYEVLKTHTAEEAIVIARQECPDLILMDISLPLMDGREAVEILKGDERTKAIPIVAFTAHLLGEDWCARSGGCDGYLTKPFEAAELLGEVRRLVNNE